jgi:hypothetical protein
MTFKITEQIKWYHKTLKNKIMPILIKNHLNKSKKKISLYKMIKLLIEILLIWLLLIKMLMMKLFKCEKN